MEKQKYKLKTKIGQNVYKVSINIRAPYENKKTTIHENGIHLETHKIVFQTFWKIAINDKWITCFDRQKEDQRKDSYHIFIGYNQVSIITKETYFPNGVFGSIYTIDSNTDKAIKELSKYMQKKINDEYSFLSNINVDDKVNEYLELL